MGFGLPAAIGAYLAKPENLVLNITGDGSFQMNLQKVANIETVCKMLDTQGDIVRKMLKDDIESASKDIQDL